MAMGGLMKGHGGYGNGSRGRPYGMMLLLAFGAAIIGVMVLHRFRERRIFNLLIKEKDDDLISLHLLLQKERDHVKGTKWKLEDMRAKIHTLRAQKRELDNRIMEMRSTVSSLREEQKIIESALEEKQNVIKMMRDKNTHIDTENPQVKALSETLRHKESEIEDLNHHLESPVNVWSVSTDDPSKASLNSRMKTRTTERDEKNVNQGKESSGELNVSTTQEVGENSTEHADSSSGETGNNRNEEVAKQGEVRRQNGDGIREMTGEQSQKQDNSKESNTEERIVEGKGKNRDISQNGGEEKETAKTEAIGNHDIEVQRPRDETNEGNTSDDKVTETTGDDVLGSYDQGAEIQERGANLKEGMKLEMPDNSRIERHRRIGKNSKLKRAKGKRWTIMTRSKAGNSENSGVAVMSDKRSVESTIVETLDNSEPQNKSLSLRNETGAEDPGLKISDNLQKGEASEHEDSKNEGQEPRNTASYIQMEERERTNGTSVKTEMPHISLKDALTNITLQTDDSKASLEREQNVHEIGQSEQSEKQATGIQQLAEEIARQKEDEVSEQTKTADFDEEPNNPETEDLQEQESETETSRESTSNSETDGEESKGNNDEPEF